MKINEEIEAPANEITIPTSNTLERVIWSDGCYDLVHFGHANSLRQARALGKRLIVGVHGDGAVAEHKRQPIMTLAERCRLVGAIRWVDEVVPNAPYITTNETLTQYGCSVCCHGGDLSTTQSGEDTYALIKADGRYQEVERTAGVSTTGLVKRILDKFEKRDEEGITQPPSPYTGNQFFLTAQRLADFVSKTGRPKSSDRVVYTAGAFDLFHTGHVDFLERARHLGDALIVGVYGDDVVAAYKGAPYPIQTLQERVLSVLACRYVTDVLIAAPTPIPQELITALHVNCVAFKRKNSNTTSLFLLCNFDREKCEVVDIDSDNGAVSTAEIVKRVLRARDELKARNAAKEMRELERIISEGMQFEEQI